MDTWAILLTIFLSVVCGVVSNLWTPHIKGFLTRGIKGYRKSKLDKYIEKYEVLKFYSEHPDLALRLAIEDIMKALYLSLIAVAFLLVIFLIKPKIPDNLQQYIPLLYSVPISMISFSSGMLSVSIKNMERSRKFKFRYEQELQDKINKIKEKSDVKKAEKEERP
jgi:hypothetical protein